MATLHISEYDKLAKDPMGHGVPVPQEPAIATQSVTFTTSAQSAVFNPKTRYIRIIADEKAHFLIDDSPVATASSPPIAADTSEFFGLSRTGLRIAAYDGTS